MEGWFGKIDRLDILIISGETTRVEKCEMLANWKAESTGVSRTTAQLSCNCNRR